MPWKLSHLPLSCLLFSHSKSNFSPKTDTIRILYMYRNQNRRLWCSDNKYSRWTAGLNLKYCVSVAFIRDCGPCGCIKNYVLSGLSRKTGRCCGALPTGCGPSRNEGQRMKRIQIRKGVMFAPRREEPKKKGERRRREEREERTREETIFRGSKSISIFSAEML